MNMPTLKAKSESQRKQRSALNIEQVLDDLDALLESSQPLGKNRLWNRQEGCAKMGPKYRREK